MSGEEYVRRMQERSAAEAVETFRSLTDRMLSVLRKAHCAHDGCLQRHTQWDLIIAERIAAELTKDV